jgi:RimJ/RimL family protein N-acetyltransferase
MTTTSPVPLTPTEITAGRLHLRPWQPADADAVLAACQDPELQRWTSVPVPYEAGHAEEYVTRISPQGWHTGTAAQFAVLDATTAALLGSTSLMSIDREAATAEVGFWCVEQARGRGVMTEAVGAVCRWGFGALGLQRITWLAHVGNAASRRVAEKAGFVPEGTLRSFLVARGQRHDAWIAGLLPGDPVPEVRAAAGPTAS